MFLLFYNYIFADNTDFIFIPEIVLLLKDFLNSY